MIENVVSFFENVEEVPRIMKFVGRTLKWVKGSVKK